MNCLCDRSIETQYIHVDHTNTATYVLYIHVVAYITSIFHIFFVDTQTFFSKLKHFLFRIANLFKVCNLKYELGRGWGV